MTFDFYKRTYPFKKSNHTVRDSITYGVFIWAILYFLQPFGFATYQGNKLLASALFGLITFCCHFTYVWALFKFVLPHVNPWRIWHTGCSTLCLIVIIAVGNFLLFAYLYQIPFSFDLFFTFLYWTLIIGVLMTALSTGIQYNRTLKERMEELLRNTTEEQKDVTITIHDTSVRGNDLLIPINSLLYIEAQKNNISVCYLKEDKPTFAEIHTTLSNAIEELKEYENIFQCHRSFVVNANNITSARGNSNGYQLTLGENVQTIPVSRSFVPKMKSFIA